MKRAYKTVFTKMAIAPLGMTVPMLFSAVPCVLAEEQPSPLPPSLHVSPVVSQDKNRDIEAKADELLQATSERLSSAEAMSFTAIEMRSSISQAARDLEGDYRLSRELEFLRFPLETAPSGHAIAQSDDVEIDPVEIDPIEIDLSDGLSEAEEGDLARQSQNPIANLISLPFQNNTNFGVGQYDRTSNVLNIQPVLPTPLSEDLLLVNRVIVPLAYQPELAPGIGDTFGLGDILYQGFLSPPPTGNFSWGAGPAISFPTATDTVLGSDKWSAGPAVVGIWSIDRIVTGALINNIWSFAGDGDRQDVSFLTLQPFFNYNLDDGWFINTAPIINANWEASGDDVWTVPVGAGFGRVFAIGRQPVNMSAAAYWNAIKPEGAADWTLRLQMSFLFPQ
jgi:hypothetical protein